MKKSEDKFKVFFHNAAESMIVVSDKGDILEVNNIAIKRYGYGREEFLKLKIKELDAPDIPTALKKNVKTTIKEGYTIFERVHYKKDRSKIPVEVSCSSIEYGKKKVLLAIIRDITERKSIENALRERERSLNEAQQLAHIGSWSWIIKNDEVKWSKELYKITGQNPKLSPPKYADHAALYTKKSWKILKQAVKKAVIQGVSYDMELDMVHPSGQIINTNTKGRAVKDKSGRIVRLYGTVQDITGLKQTEEKIKIHEHMLSNLLNLHRMDRSKEEKIFDFTLKACLSSTKSKFAFIGTISEDNREMIAHSWSEKVMDYCSLAVKPLRFSVIDAGLWGEVIKQKRAIMINDYKTSKEFKKGYPKGHIPLKRFLGVPVFSEDRVVFVAAVANKVETYNESDINALTSLVNEMWNLIERKKAEDNLKMHAQILENLTEGVNLIDENGIIRYTNNKFDKMFGYKKGELIGKNITIVNAHSGIEQDIFRSLKAKGKWSGEILNRRKDGSTFYSMANVIKTKSKNKTEIISAQSDISERKESQKALIESEERYRTLIENIDLGITLIDKEHKIIMANNEFCRRTGFPKDKAEGRLCYEISARRDSVCPDCPGTKAMALEKTVKIESERLSYDGSRLPVIIHAFPVLDENNKVKAIVEVTEDISEYKKVEKAKKNLIRDLSHGLKTPISMIEMSLAIIMNNLDPRNKINLIKAKRIAEENIRKVRSDINGILNEFSIDIKKETLSKDKKALEKASLRISVKDAAKNLKSFVKSKNLKFNMLIPLNTDKIKIKAGDLKTLLDNLLENAIKFTNAGEVSVISRLKGKMVEIEIKDTGFGISRKDINRVFDKFYKRHASIEGTGLGLSICKELVEMYDGEIEISSKGVEKGTTVIVRLPKG